MPHPLDQGPTPDLTGLCKKGEYRFAGGELADIWLGEYNAPGAEQPTKVSRKTK